MSTKYEMKYLFFLIFLTSGITVHSQSFQIGSVQDETLRLLQLKGKLSLDYGFTSRPYTEFDSINTSNVYSWLNNGGKTSLGNGQLQFKKDKKSIKWLPLNWAIQYNSHHPYGWNDGLMIPAKGIQSMVSGGLFVKYGPLSVQFQPEFVYATNAQFDTSKYFGTIVNKNYSKAFLGQSSIRLNIKHVSLGISSENLWWGPGKFSSLVMSNNAPGFLHLTFNSIKPIKTAIGSFEWQIISGRLEHDTTNNSQVYILKNADKLIYPRTKDWRYLNGLTITWQPKWFQGLYIGVNRVFQVYHDDLTLPPVNFIDDYLPVIGTFFKKSINSTEDDKNRDQLLSLFARLIFQKVQAEMYFEYGRGDHSYNLRDFLMTPQHSEAYIFGFKKYFPTKGNSGLLLEAEVTHMQESVDRIVRGADTWYEHGKIKTGYTHNNQIIGAGSGFGNNVQTFSLKHIKGWKQLGFMIEKMDYHPYVQATPLKETVQWSDFALGLLGQIKKENFVVRIETKFIYSDNYSWLEKKSAFNLFGLVSLKYIL